MTAVCGERRIISAYLEAACTRRAGHTTPHAADSPLRTAACTWVSSPLCTCPCLCRGDADGPDGLCGWCRTQEVNR